MPMYPVHKIGARGIIKDTPGYQLPLEAFSDGNNVRFSGGCVERAPVFRTVDTLTPTAIIGGGALYEADGTDNVFMIESDGTQWVWASGIETEVTAAGYTPATNTDAVTFTTLAGVAYYNRNTHAPLKSDGGQFEAVANWPASTTCRVLRTYKDFLVALDITDGGGNAPSDVLWSDINVAYGDEPPSWDTSDPTTSAGRTPLSEADGALLDGMPLRDDFIIYTRKQTWVMTHTGGRFVMQFKKLFDNAGILSTNCALEVDGVHYVMSENDIWMHNGVTKDSVLVSDDGGVKVSRLRRFYQRDLDNSKKHRAFVAYDPLRQDVLFCYPSNSANIKWPGADYCTRAISLNVQDGSLGIRDLPNVSFASFAKVGQTTTWSTVSGTWSGYGSSWADQGDATERQTIMPSSTSSGVSLTSTRLLALDGATYESRLAYSIDDELVTDAFVAREYYDLDEIGTTLNQWKVLSAIWPQISTYNNDSVEFSCGSASHSGAAIDYETAQTFNPTSDVKCDFMCDGRYFAIRLDAAGSVDFSWSGFHVSVHTTGQKY